MSQSIWAQTSSIVSSKAGVCNSATAIGTVYGAALAGPAYGVVPQWGSGPFLQAQGLYLPLVNGEEASDSGQFGAIQNRFESTISGLQAVSENLTASRSRIQDADFAAETAALTKAQILQQAGTAVLAQANAVPQTVLSLFR